MASPEVLNITVENLNNTECRLTVVVPSSSVTQAYTKQINLISKKAKIDGFRPGKIPPGYVQKKFGASAQEEAVSEVVRNSLAAAISEKALKPVNVPKIELKNTENSTEFTYTATFEVIPGIEQVNFNIDQIEKPVVQVSASDVDYVIAQLAKQYTAWQPVSRKTVLGDRVVIDYHTVYEGVADKDHQLSDRIVELGSKTMLPGFEEGLLDLNPGDEKTLSLKYPDDLPNSDRAGKQVDFVVSLKEVYEGTAPEWSESFVKKLGVASGQLDDLKKQIEKTLDQEKERLVSDHVKAQLFKQLLEQNTVDVPTSLVALEAKNIHDEVYPQHVKHNHHDHSEHEMNQFNETAKKRVALSLLVSAFAKHEQVTLDPERVEKRIEQIASHYEDPKEVVKWLNTKEQKNNVEAQVLEDQVIESMMNKTKVVEKNMTYAELKGIRI